jgi:hypothetical protein
MDHPHDAITTHRLAAEHLAACMCIELIDHAAFAMGECTPDMQRLRAEMQERVATGLASLPKGLIIEGAPLHAADRTELVAVLVLMWDLPAERLQRHMSEARSSVAHNLLLLMMLAATPSSGSAATSDWAYIQIRICTLYTMQCHTLLGEMLDARARLPPGSPPTADFFLSMLPRVCATGFASVLTPEVLRTCPGVW